MLGAFTIGQQDDLECSLGPNPAGPFAFGLGVCARDPNSPKTEACDEDGNADASLVPENRIGWARSKRTAFEASPILSTSRF